MARQMAGFQPDVAVLAGDLAESLADFGRCQAMFRRELSCPLWVLPGDRDFWARPPYDSHRLWSELLPDAVKRAGCGWLEGEAFVQGGVAIAGSIAWYDYSSATMACMVTDLEFAQHKYLHNADALRIDWEWSDPEFAGRVGAALLATLDLLEQDVSVGAIVVLTHFPILEQQLHRQPGMGLASAYAGNLTLGRKVLARRKLTHVISGHAHVARHTETARAGLAPVEVHVLPGDYEKPAWIGLTIGK
jgi:hypothetical protein